MKPRDLLALRSIRERKENTACDHLRSCKEKVISLEDESQQLMDDLKQYRTWRSQHESELYTALQSQPVSPHGLQDYLASLNELSSREQYLEAQLAEADSNVKNAKVDFENARKTWRNASRSIEKIDIIAAHNKKPRRSNVM